MTGVSGFMRFEHQQVSRNTPVRVLWVSCGVLGVKYTLCSMFWAILGCFLSMVNLKGQTRGHSGTIRGQFLKKWDLGP